MCAKQVNQRLVWISSMWTPRSSMGGEIFLCVAHFQGVGSLKQDQRAVGRRISAKGQMG
ncbi:unnamed protein product, partial [Larinioides sclopetarius]